MGCCLERVAILLRRGVGGYRCIVGFAVIRTAMGLCLGVIRRHANQVGGILPGTSVHCGREGDGCPARRGRLLRPLRPPAVIGRYFESSSRSEFEGQHARHADSSSRDTSSQFPSHQENGLELSAPTMQVSSLASSSKIGSSHGSLGSSVFAAWSFGLQGSGRENRVAVVLRSLKATAVCPSGPLRFR